MIFLTVNDQERDQTRDYKVVSVNYITNFFLIVAVQIKTKAIFSMLEHCNLVKDVYDDGRLFLNFLERVDSLNRKPLILFPMEYKMLNLFRKKPKQFFYLRTAFKKLRDLRDIDEKFVDKHH